LGVTAALYTFRFLSIGEIEGYVRGGVSAREFIESSPSTCTTTSSTTSQGSTS
jgi:hypothetical protein